MIKDLNLSNEEHRLMSRLQDAGQVELDALHAMVGGSRKGLVVKIKYLTAKLAPHGWIISRVSDIGRGNKAVYQMDKKFSVD